MMRKLPGPRKCHDLKLQSPIDSWDEGIPLGNGLMGMLLWGQEQTIRLSLDRGDLWDCRPITGFQSDDWNWATLKRLVAEGNAEAIDQIFEAPCRTSPHPTKLPAGRIELTFPRAHCARQFHLRLRDALGSVDLGDASLQAFCSATDPVCLLKVTGAQLRLKIIPPDDGGERTDSRYDVGEMPVSMLGYPAPECGRSGAVSWVRQRGIDGFEYAIFMGRQTVGDETIIGITVSTNHNRTDAVSAGRQRVASAIQTGFDTLRRRHQRWWKAFWSSSAVSIADPEIEKHYYLVRYFYGSASRRGAPPSPCRASGPPMKAPYHPGAGIITTTLTPK